MKSRRECTCHCHDAFSNVKHMVACCRDDDLEDFCGDEYDRGLGRVWICSLPVDGHTVHEAYEWHNIAGRKVAAWQDKIVIGYLAAFDEWIEVN